MVEQTTSLVELSIKNIDIAALNLVPEEFALKNRVLPYKIQEENLYIALKCDEEMELMARLRLLTNMNIFIVRYPEAQLIKSITKAYEYLKFNHAIEKLMSSFSNAKDKTVSNIIPKEDSKAPAVMILNYIINNSITSRASDIHFEPQENHLLIRYRVDGSLIEFFTIPMEVYSAIVTRLKVLCSMDISEKRTPQDGKFQYDYCNKTLDLRVSAIPVFFGEKFVVRILDKDIDHCNLQSIYNNSEQNKLIKKLLLNNNGIILATGPTGSGKSTTLYAMLKELNCRCLNITTIEDPVEYTMKGINQISVNSKVGLTFAAGLRSILRQDPDVIMIGEIRDEETAAIAIRAAITGHLVLSTLHTNDAPGAVNRLVEMGIERYLLADALVAVIAQRLVRRICDGCRESYPLTQFERKLLKEETITTLYKGRGCDLCNYSGYLGRIALTDILQIDDKNRLSILKGEGCHETNSSQGISTLSEQCKYMVLRGITTLEELIKVSNGRILD
jgi:type IV pilus assembly protein PilB